MPIYSTRLRLLPSASSTTAAKVAEWEDNTVRTCTSSRIASGCNRRLYFAACHGARPLTSKEELLAAVP